MRETRRDFLRKVPGRVALAVAVTETFLTVGCEGIDPYVNGIRNDENLLETGIQGSLLSGVLGLFAKAAERLGVSTGNAQFLELARYQRSYGLRTAGENFTVKNRPRIADALLKSACYTFTGVIGPAIEEYFYRHWVSERFLPYQKGIRWDVGIPDALAFAYSHNINILRIFEGKFPIVLNVIPVESFISGLYFWKKYREKEEKGLLHATVMHGAYNISAGFWANTFENINRIITR